MRPFVACLSLSLLVASAAAEQVMLFPYFDSNGENGVFLAASRDGREFVKVNDGKPIFRPPQWRGQSLTRDPSIVWHDGQFHMVWTSNWGGNVFGYASSPDMQEWSEPKRVQPFPDGAEQPNNVWAPEVFRDPVADDFKVVWSSTLPSEMNDGDGSEDRHNADHRMYYVSTTDFKSYSTPELLFQDEGYSVIDAFVAFDQQNNRWVMTLKKEQDQSKGGKNLRLAFSPAEIGPSSFGQTTQPIVGPGSDIKSNAWAEGASLVRWGDQWRLYWDAYTKGHYGLAVSDDLESWTDKTEELNIPVRHPRHGTVFIADSDNIAWELPLPEESASP